MSTQKKWEVAINKKLKGKTIKACRYLTAEEMEDTGWYNNPIVIEFTDGSYVLPMQDDEGNDGGAMSTSFEDLPTIPVMGAEA